MQNFAADLDDYHHQWKEEAEELEFGQCGHKPWVTAPAAPAEGRSVAADSTSAWQEQAGASKIRKELPSFKEAVASPARSSDRNNFGNRLVEVERSLKEHKREGSLRQREQRLEQLERWSEQLERWSKQQNLILYNVTEGDGEKAFEMFCESFAEKPQRLGQRHTRNDHALPLRLTFASNSLKHEFLRIAKDSFERSLEQKASE
ncbi:TPA: hypothetical protein ACH3X1_007617 [Trebouxia sp. C0004]